MWVQFENIKSCQILYSQNIEKKLNKKPNRKASKGLKDNQGDDKH